MNEQDIVEQLECVGSYIVGATKFRDAGFRAREVCRNASDTITTLRTQLSEAKAEIELLKRDKAAAEYWQHAAECEEEREASKVAALRADNARLREAAGYVRRALDHYAPSIPKMKQRLDKALADTPEATQ